MDARYCLRFKKITLDLPLAREIFRIGIPAAIQTIVITLSNIVVQTNINGLGVNSIAAYAAYFKVENVIYLPIMALGQACSTFISQNVGVGKIMRSKRGTAISIYFGLAVTAVSISLVLFLQILLSACLQTTPRLSLSAAALPLLLCRFTFICFPRDACFVNPRQRQHFADDVYYSGKYVRYPHRRIKINYVF